MDSTEGRSEVRLTRYSSAATSEGPEFKYKLAGLIALRASRRKLKFELFCNVNAARPCEDLVLRVLKPEPWTFYVPLKYSTVDRDISANNFLTDTGNYSIKKIFSFYTKLKSWYEKGDIQKTEDEHLLTSGPLENSRIVLYTTKTTTINHIGRENIGPLGYLQDLWVTGNGNIEDVFYFQSCDTKIWDMISDERKNLYQNEFLPRFLIYTRQCRVKELDGFILDEINKVYGFSLPRSKTICTKYISVLKSWAEDDKGSALTDGMLELGRALALMLQELASAAAFCDTLTFQDNAYQNLCTALRRPGNLRVVVPNVVPGVRATKLLQVLQKYFPGDWTYVNEEILYEYPTAALVVAGYACKILVLDMVGRPEKLPELLNKITTHVLHNTSPIKLVTLCSSEEEIDDNYEVDEWKMTELTDEAQEILLNSHLKFQGSPVSLRRLEITWPRLREDCDGALLGALVRGRAELGAAPPDPDDGSVYISRTLQHNSALRPSVLGLRSTHDHLALSGFTRQDLEGLRNDLALGLDVDLERNSRWTILSAEQGREEEALERIRAEQRPRNVHWVERVDASEDRAGAGAALSLLWRRSHGRQSALASHVLPGSNACARAPLCVHTANSVRDVATWTAPTGLLVGDGGVGKTSLLKHAAALARVDHPTRWTVFVQLLDHREMLRQWPPPSELTKEHVQELLEAAAGVAKTTSCAAASRRYLAAALEGSVPVRVYFDAVDEVCPAFEQHILQVLRLLPQVGNVSVWVTARTEMQDSLQRILRCAPATLKPLSPPLQAQYLCDYWASVHERPASDFRSLADELVRALIANAAGEEGDHGFLQVPLHTHMAAEAYANEAIEALRDGTTLLGDATINLLNIYRLFIQRRREVYQRRHGFYDANVGNVNIDDQFVKIHKAGAMVVLISEGPYESVDLRQFEMDIAQNATFLSREKTGIMWMGQDRSLHFAHPSFSEFFAASWIFENPASDIAIYVRRQLPERSKVRMFLRMMVQELQQDL